MDVVGIDVRQNAMIDDRGIPHVVFCGVDDVVSIENGLDVEGSDSVDYTNDVREQFPNHDNGNGSLDYGDSRDGGAQLSPDFRVENDIDASRESLNMLFECEDEGAKKEQDSN